MRDQGPGWPCLVSGHDVGCSGQRHVKQVRAVSAAATAARAHTMPSIADSGVLTLPHNGRLHPIGIGGTHA